MSLSVDLGGITIDAGRLVRQLRFDLKDDFCPDPFGYEDFLSPERISEAFSDALERSNGRFPTEARTEVDLPKPRFILRNSLETSLLDRAYYHVLASYLLPYYDRLLPQNVLSFRYSAGSRRQGRYLFVNRIEQWKHFYACVRQALRKHPVVVVTDIYNYFENISLDDLLDLLDSRVPVLQADPPEKVRIRHVISELRRCLQDWCYSKGRGLPQNRDASSILGNLLLLSVDEAMLARGYTYFRYMDDIRIATTSRYEARAALRDLIMELRKLGLNVNPYKTEIPEPGTQLYNNLLLSRDRDLDQIDAMWRSRSPLVIRRSFKPLKRLAERLISEGKLGDQPFRFCVARFEKLALCQDLEVPSSFFQPLADTAVAELDSQPWASDQIVRFLKAAPSTTDQLSRIANFLLDHKRAIYDWQNYLLWQLLVYKEHREPRLLAAARKRFEDGGSHVDRAGAILYMGALGDRLERERVARAFATLHGHLLQRAALIAVHELDYSTIVKAEVQPFVLPSLRGTYREIRSRYRGSYYAPLPSVSASLIYDELSPYD